MSVKPTAAASALEAQDNVSSHQLISLLMAGGLERISQAKRSLTDGDTETAEILIDKITAIIGGLRNSLNFEAGGEVATNLDSLYEYMLGRIDEADEKSQFGTVCEIGELLNEVKEGWDEIEEQTA